MLCLRQERARVGPMPKEKEGEMQSMRFRSPLDPALSVAVSSCPISTTQFPDFVRRGPLESGGEPHEYSVRRR